MSYIVPDPTLDWSLWGLEERVFAFMHVPDSIDQSFTSLCDRDLDLFGHLRQHLLPYEYVITEAMYAQNYWLFSRPLDRVTMFATYTEEGWFFHIASNYGNDIPWTWLTDLTDEGLFIIRTDLLICHRLFDPDSGKDYGDTEIVTKDELTELEQDCEWVVIDTLVEIQKENAGDEPYSTELLSTREYSRMKPAPPILEYLFLVRPAGVEDM